MQDSIWKTITVYLISISILIMLVIKAYPLAISIIENRQGIKRYAQPPLSAGRFPWTVRSIDTQVVSKHWPDVSKEQVSEQIKLIKDLGVNYIAVDTPYDRIDDLALWVDEIHSSGLNVWFRSHWAEWEGDVGRPSTMKPDQYLYLTRQFILNHPELFREGDAFTVAVEAEQVGIGLGKRFLTWDQYRKFLLSEIEVASLAFEEIGLKGKIHTNWLSVNGWVAENQFSKELLESVGLIVVDHFRDQSQTIGQLDDIDKLVANTISDLDFYYEKFGVPILLGEWGYQIFQDVPDERQAEVIEKLFNKLKAKTYLVGVNYWVHMGNPAAIINDQYGTNLTYRLGADVIKSFYAPVEQITDKPIKKLSTFIE